MCPPAIDDLPLDPPTAPRHAPGDEPLPGYRLLAPLGRGGFGEVWKCEAPGGLHKAVKFVPNDKHALEQAGAAQEELAAIARVKAIRHPFVLMMERVEEVADELVIVMELADQGLGDALAAARAAGQAGLPRDQLLGLLREAAEALDLMHSRYGLQHLDIKPQNLFLVSGHVKVGDFGLVSSCAPGGLAAINLGAITPLYASPEVFQGRVSPHSDQYSLAIVYQELLTGTLPYDGKNSRQLLMQHLTMPPDLSPLSEADRAVVGRALSKSPAERFPTCSDFVAALVSGQADVVTATVVPEPAPAETRPVAVARTVRAVAAPAVRPPSVPGLRGLSLVSRNPLAEVWSAAGVDGAPRTVKVLFGCPARPDEAAVRLEALRHPALVPTTVHSCAAGKVVVSHPDLGRPLRDLLAERLARGESGMEREPLLAVLREAAVALDALRQQTGLMHLTLSPRVLSRDGERARIADFGLAALLWLPAGQSVTAVNARYAAPELAARQAAASSDQYSLAVIYTELLTGAVPRQSRLGGAASDVDRLPEGDRAAVARALSTDPAARWASATELFDALGARRADEPAAPAPPVAPTRAGLHVRLGTSLAAEQVGERLEEFRQHWKAERVEQGPRQQTLRFAAPRSLWQRQAGAQPELEAKLAVSSPEPGGPARTEVFLSLRACDGADERSRELLDAVGPLIVEGLRNHLRADAWRREHERVAWHHPLRVCPRGADGGLLGPIECQGKDLSLTGIGFYLPGGVPAGEVMLLLPRTPQTPSERVPARVVRSQPCGDGWHEVGAVLLPPDELPEDVG